MIFQYKTTPIYYETFGKGSAIVLLHGFLESTTMWKSLIPQLSKNNTVITIDLPGHGKSEVISEIHTMELMAEVVAQILQQLQISKASFIGHSMGGYVALAYTELFSEKVVQLILLNSTSIADSEERKENRNRAIAIMDQNPKAFISMAIGNLFAETSRKKFSKEIEALKAEAYSFPVEGIKAAAKGMRDRKDRTAVFKNFENEKHLILAEDDPILTIEEGRRLAENCNVSLKIIAGGHMSVIENQEAVLAFFQDVFN
ncbi:alpha/beta hydrolase [Aequorivita sp. Q41]|uniref:alpha/beta fold hydrolase n=1 Tax=Aequorivita sp. Q41 TaxID=3153300 RepID=UPI003242B11D